MHRTHVPGEIDADADTGHDFRFSEARSLSRFRSPQRGYRMPPSCLHDLVSVLGVCGMHTMFGSGGPGANDADCDYGWISLTGAPLLRPRLRSIFVRYFEG